VKGAAMARSLVKKEKKLNQVSIGKAANGFILEIWFVGVLDDSEGYKKMVFSGKEALLLYLETLL